MTTYAELVAYVEDTTATTYETSQMDTFIQTAEKVIYQTMNLPVMMTAATGTFTANNRYLTLPSGFLYMDSLAVIVSSSYSYLIPKEIDFIREAYPNPSTTGVPTHYAIFNSTTLLVGPTPGSGYTTEMHYATYPESIVTASTTWLGDNFPSALINGTLIEAMRFIQGPEDVMATYKQLYTQSIELLKNWSDNKLERDIYRNGPPSQIPSR